LPDPEKSNIAHEIAEENKNPIAIEEIDNF
jgi:hypothetical protein